ncbi:DoxX family protein [Arvimicrobium flavum]|uniref:DoxX family protein n=1 Tax=Arvimicrobium flavum TaxID=3393320 RepID=UPI00237A131D|nr:DoxX family protein [Mesorhizobium shangrilense]
MLDNLGRHAPIGLALLRIMTALLFIAHGTQKLFGFPASGQAAGDGGLSTLMLAAGILETFGGLLILVGFLTRPVAFILSGMMAVAYFMAHAPQSFFPILNGGEGAILFCFVFFYLFLAGPGAWSIDRSSAA